MKTEQEIKQKRDYYLDIKETASPNSNEYTIASLLVDAFNWVLRNDRPPVYATYVKDGKLVTEEV